MHKMMKKLLLCFSLLIMTGCTSLRNMIKNNDPHIVQAGYHYWSESPVHGSTIPESGIDLSVIVKNWPNDATPSYIIYDHHASFRPTITDSSKSEVVMSARIVLTSSVLRSRSQHTDLSDRLVYETADGKTHDIKIDHWTQVKDLK